MPAVFLLVACGGPDPTWIPNGSSGSTPSAQPGSPPSATPDGGAPKKDAGPSYRDPNAGDGACASPNLVCGAACVDVSSDHENCGGCGKACSGGDSVCLAGRCACAQPLFDYCGQGCQDVSQDTDNCGACGNVCDPNQYNACVQGSCVLVE